MSYYKVAVPISFALTTLYEARTCTCSEQDSTLCNGLIVFESWVVVLLAKKTDVQFRVWWRYDLVRILRDFPTTCRNTPISITLISCLLVVAANKTFQRVFWLPIPQADKCMADL